MSTTSAPIFVEWYPAHVVEDPAKMECNQRWAEGVYRLLREGGLVFTTFGTYVRRDGGLYQIRSRDQAVGTSSDRSKSST